MTDHSESTEHGMPSNGLPNDWQRLDPLLDAVLDTPLDRRDLVARELSAGDEGVYAELRDLAAECERNRAFLDRPADERFAALLGADAFAVPDLLAERYQIRGELGHGGMARVYLARDLKHSRDVAVKVLRPEFGAVVGPARFLKEIEIVARLQHPHIVPLHDSGESDGLLYYVMPYEHGLSVRQRLEREGTLSTADTIAILRDVCEALTYAHALGIVHRDIKPDNVLLSANHALVADFGIARLVTDAATEAETQTLPGLLVGTPTYMAPEQAVPNAPIDHRADVYALGVLAYELLVGKPPFAGESYEAVLAGHLTQTATPVKSLVPSVPAKLDALIMRCLAKQPADRWQSAEEILRELDGTNTVVAPSHSATGSLRRWRWPLLAVGLLGLAVLPVTAWWRTHRVSNVDQNRVAVVRFRNGTTDSTDVFGSIIADVITNGLARTEAVNVVPAGVVMAAVAPRSGIPSPNDPRAIARATGAGIIVTGSYFRQRDSLGIQAEIIDVARDRPLSPVDLVMVPSGDQQRGILAALDRVAVALSGRVNPRIADLVAVSHLPMSMAAYREYAEALDLYYSGETRLALRHVYEAIRLDSTSTNALLLAAVMEWAESGDLPRVDSLLRRVERFKTQLPPYDLAYFDWLRAWLDGDLEAVLRATRRRPDLLGGGTVVQASIRLNRLDTAYALITEVMKRPVTQRHPRNWEFLTQILHMRGEYDRELREAQIGLAEMRTTASEPAVADALRYEIRALAALGRLEDLRRALDEMHTLRGTSEVFASVTRELRWHGHPAAADVIGRVAEQWYRDALTRSSDRHVRLLLAQTLFYLERWKDARAVFDSLAAETLPAPFTSERGRSLDLIAFAYIGIDDARRGDTSAANASIARVGQFYDAYQFGGPSYYEALISAELGQCDRTMAFLREALTRGNSVFDSFQLEALEFKRIERCTAFEDLRDRPYSSPDGSR